MELGAYPDPSSTWSLYELYELASRGYYEFAKIAQDSPNKTMHVAVGSFANAAIFFVQQ